MSDIAVEREQDGGLTIIRLARPGSMNALTEEVKAALDSITADFFGDSSQRCLLITGSGTAFCAGGDLKTLAGGLTGDATRGRMARSHNWARRLLTGPKPVVAAVNGAAVGAGFSLALMADVVIASSQAYFLPAFPLAGVAADLGLALTLPRAVGMPRAKDILLNNRRISAAEAAEMGMISRVVDETELMPAALAAAGRLAAGATLALGLTKSLLNKSYDVAIEDFLTAETEAQVRAFASIDCREGVDAFFARRSPIFHGR